MSKTLLSFDIGTRHLAYCALQHVNYKKNDIDDLINNVDILDWKVVDLLTMKGTPYDDSVIYILAKSWKVAKIKEWLHCKHLSTEGKKEELINRIHKQLKKEKVKKIKSNDLTLISTMIFSFLDANPSFLDNDIVVLENQPSLTNPIMKSVQMIIYSYFRYNGVWLKYVQNKKCQKIILTSATNKLKLFNKKQGGDLETKPEVMPKKLNYKLRKELAIQNTFRIINEKDIFRNKWLALFKISCKKEKDDLSDCFLQGLYTIYKFNNS